MNARDATHFVREMDAIWSPRNEMLQEDAYKAHLRAMSNDLLAAFEGLAQVTLDDLRETISIIRRRAMQSADPMEKLRRPSAWDLRREWERTHQNRTTGPNCGTCGGRGRTHRTAAWWKNERVVATGLVVRCDCAAGVKLQREDGGELLASASEWSRNVGVVRDGKALIQVFDVSPVYANVVAWALRDLAAGEVPDDHTITNVLRAVQEAEESDE